MTADPRPAFVPCSCRIQPMAIPNGLGLPAHRRNDTDWDVFLDRAFTSNAVKLVVNSV